MAFFKFRSFGKKGADEQPAVLGPAESVEVMRRRARHRLIGAAVLVLLGVVGFPLLFDTQPRPIPVDIPIEIPDKAKVKPLAVPADTVTLKKTAPAEVAPATPPAMAGKAPATAGVTTGSSANTGVAPSASLGAKEEVVAARPEPKPEPKAEAKPEPKPEAKPEPKPEPKAEAKAEAKPKSDDGAKAKALLEGKPTEVAAADSSRFIVQVGAFSEAARAREARQKVEKAGLKTYTQEVETPDGKRIRVRVGPFATRAEADKAASKIKGLDLPASILSL